jgi:hypothetical protein
MTIKDEVRYIVNNIKIGELFSLKGFKDIYSHASVMKELKALTGKGMIENVMKGYYVKSSILKRLPGIEIPVSCEQIARLWAEENSYILVDQGMEAAYRMGLQKQAPVRTIFWSDGPSRIFKLGDEIVQVQNTDKKWLKWAEEPAGDLLRALSMTSPRDFNTNRINKAIGRLKLSKDECFIGG